jgi:hypothetical protein
MPARKIPLHKLGQPAQVSYIIYFIFINLFLQVNRIRIYNSSRATDDSLVKELHPLLHVQNVDEMIDKCYTVRGCVRVCVCVWVCV